MDNVEIVDAVAEDVPAIAAILNHEVLHTTAVWSDEPYTDEWMATWFELRRDKGWPVLVARYQGRVVGYATYGEFRSRAGYRDTMEHSVYVDGAVHRGGIGRLLLGALMERARANGVHVLVGGIADENTASLGLHRALGFHEVARMPEVGQKFGRWLTLIFMQKIL
jgi:L-amino acid N-acyltransferase YncA